MVKKKATKFLKKPLTSGATIDKAKKDLKKEKLSIHKLDLSSVADKEVKSKKIQSTDATAPAAAAATQPSPSLINLLNYAPDPIKTQVYMAVKEDQVRKAVNALFAFRKQKKASKGKQPEQQDSGKKNKKELLPLDDDEDEEGDGKLTAMWLMVTLKKVPEHAKAKPIRIPLKHSVLPKDGEVCLITKDPQREFEELLEKHNVKLDMVISVSKLKTEYKPYEAKRQLCASYDLFLADDRVLPILPPILGKTFFVKKKQPAPVTLTLHNIKGEIESARSSTYVHLSMGTCIAIKVGHTALSEEQIIENIMHALPYVVDRLPRKWSNILALQLKMSDSVALPIYTDNENASLLNAAAGDNKRKAAAEHADDAEGDGDEDEEKVEPANDKKDNKKKNTTTTKISPPSSKTVNGAATQTSQSKKRKIAEGKKETAAAPSTQTLGEKAKQAEASNPSKKQPSTTPAVPKGKSPSPSKPEKNMLAPKSKGSKITKK